MTLEAHFDLLEIEDKYKDDIDTMEINNFWISITSIRRRTPTIPVDHTPGEHHDTADGEDHGQKEATNKAKTTPDKSNRLRYVLRLRGRALLPGPQYLNTRCKIYRATIRARTTNAIRPRLTAQRGHSRPRLAICAMERDENWTTILKSTSKYWSRALQGIAGAQQCTKDNEVRARELQEASTAPVPPEEHHDAADEQDHRQMKTTEKAKSTYTQPGSNLVEVKKYMQTGHH